VQLEGLRRQLPRGLSPADCHPDLFQGARLRRLPCRDARYYSKQHAPSRTLKEGEELAATAVSYAQLTARKTLSILLALPEHHVQHLSGQHVVRT
jgi:hypothetical protein